MGPPTLSGHKTIHHKILNPNSSSQGRLTCRPGDTSLAGPKTIHHEALNPIPQALGRPARRPGDTILMEPGAPHEVNGVVISWPLHIVGGGASGADTVLLCPQGADAALEFRCALGDQRKP